MSLFNPYYPFHPYGRPKMSDEYRAVILTLEQLREDSIMVSVPKMQGWQPIPRSLIHGGDNLGLVRHRHNLPITVTIRIFSWKADQLHLT